MTISTDKLHYTPKTRTFSEEMSSLGLSSPGTNVISLTNPKTGISKEYKHYKTDMDGSNEDIYGWNYHNHETNTYLLLIND
jgi:hypothetical protein